MKKLTITALVLLLVAYITAPAFAKRNSWEASDDHGSQRMERIEHLKLLLDLTEGQEADIEGVINNDKQQAEAHRTLVQANREKFQGLLADGSLNEARLRELAHEQADLRVEMIINRHATRMAIDQILTPEQQKKRLALKSMRVKQGWLDRRADMIGSP